MTEEKWKFGKAKVFAKLDVAKVHFVAPDGKHARCDKNTEIVFKSDLKVTDVTCAKCMRYADYKAAIKTPNDTKADESPKSTPKAKPAAKTEPKSGKGEPSREPKPPREPKVDSEPGPANPTESEPAAKDEKPNGKPKLTEDNYKEHLKAAQKPAEPEKNGKAFVSGTAPNKKLYIKHVSSNQTMFNDVNPKALETCLKYLNNLKVKWEGGSEKLPKGFVAAMRGAFEAAYKSHGLSTKVTGTPPKETPEQAAEKATNEALALMTPNANKGDTVTLLNNTYIFDGKKWYIPETEKGNIPKTEGNIPETEGRKIKRRKKVDTPKTEAKAEKRKIKRRAAKTEVKPTPKKKPKPKDKPKTEGKGKRQIKRREGGGRQFDKYGFTSGDMRSYIVGMMEKGATAKEICKKTGKKFNMDERTVQAKIQMLTRLLRKRKISLTIVCFESKEKDFYQLTEPR